jgi:putative iron-regulated protein
MRPLAACLAFSLGLLACTDSDDESGPSEDLKKQAVAAYADIVHATYSDARDAAWSLKTAVDAFVAAPSQAGFDAAKAAWKAARVPYGQSEVFRFYNGPIDNEEDGPEGLLNAWPLDEAHIDYVEDDSGAGIINDTEGYPTLDEETLAEANENPGEADIATGYHAVEFLLWGQDLTDPDEDRPGLRPYTDYVTGDSGTADNQARRGQYLKIVAGLIVEHLDQLLAAWSPDGDNYRKAFLAADPDSSLAKILVGMGSLSGAELSGERMGVALETGAQEDEHSCFSDNTRRDIILNATGIQNVFLGGYDKAAGGKAGGIGIFDLVNAVDPNLADRMKAEIASSVAAAKAIPSPFDHAVSLGNAAGRLQVEYAIEALRAQTETTSEAAEALGLELILE